MTMTTATAAREGAIRRFRLVALIAPIAGAALFAVAQLAMLPVVPEVVVIHWNAAGQPDGFGPAWTFPVLTIALGVGLPLLIAGPVAFRPAPRSGRTQLRVPAALVSFLGVFLGTLSTAALAGQSSLVRVNDAPDILPVLGLGAAFGALAALAAALISRDAPTAGSASLPPTTVPVGPGERAVWLQTATLSRAGLVVLGVALAVAIGSALVGAVAEIDRSGAPGAGTLISVGVTLLVILAVATTIVFRVRVDVHGLSVRSVAGWPRVSIPREQIARAEVVHVEPFAEYGGWGWRVALGAGTGVVTRRGDALRITRRDGRVFTITVDDAATAVGLIRGLGEREDG